MAMTFDRLQSLKDLLKKCNETIKGEPEVASAKLKLVKVEAKIDDLKKKLQDELESHERKSNNIRDKLQEPYAEKKRLNAIADNEVVIKNAKLTRKDVIKEIAELEAKLKSQD